MTAPVPFLRVVSSDGTSLEVSATMKTAARAAARFGAAYARDVQEIATFQWAYVECRRQGETRPYDVWFEDVELEPVGDPGEEAGPAGEAAATADLSGLSPPSPPDIG